jgi:hypothetical protein
MPEAEIQKTLATFLERGIGQVDKHHVRSIVTVFELYISVQLRARIVVLHLILGMLKPEP